MKEHQIEAVMSRLDEVMHQMMRRMHQKLSLSMTDKLTGIQFMVLKRINEHGRITVSGMAEDLSVSLSAVTALIDRLYKLGYVIRIRDEDDRRLVWLELTDKGSEILSVCQVARWQVIEKCFKQLPGEDLQALLRIYERMHEILLKEEDDEVNP